MSSKSKVYFFFNEVSFNLENRKLLRDYIAAIFLKEKKALETLNYVFCSDAYLLKINKTYLNHNNYTDIITFLLSSPQSPISGEIYISAERVRENAKNLGHSFKEELLRVIFHGVLHLCGYKDKAGPDKRIMRSKEDFYLLGLSNFSKRGVSREKH